MTTSNGDSNAETTSFEFVFGFGSIINSSTHAAWNNSQASKAEPLPGRIVRIRPDFGYQRRWNFRSTTGFTALGVCRADGAGACSASASMNGVLFRVPSHQMPGFDRREVGYDKVQIPLEYIEIVQQQQNQAEQQQQQKSPFELTTDDKIWIYVPQPAQCQEADENHPLLQSYVDTVLQGCLEWGGESMAEEFILSTGGWSSYFLNDTPSSRRPWLFRKDYDIIDKILSKHSKLTRYADRRHPEEFASTFLTRSMRGTWSVPRRNRHFTGRDDVLGQIHARLTQQAQDDNSSSLVGGQGSVNFLAVCGMPGVGKTSVSTEYCYRHFPSSYGLVIWLNAESAETLMADYRQLLADLADGMDVNSTTNTTPSVVSSKDNNSTDEVIGEVKTRLFRCQVPWLLVFDNLEDRKLLEKFVPRGATSGSKGGHVLVTTRVVDLESGNGPSSFVLGCLNPTESVEMLRRALIGSSTNGGLFEEGSENLAAAKQICELLGHLPLALGMAAAYMQRCDVSCVEYVDRYVRSEQAGRSLLRHQAGRLHDYSLTVSSSLSLSLKAIENESETASQVLRLLCWLGPDHITKALLRALLAAKNKADEERAARRAQKSTIQRSAGNAQQLTQQLLLLCGFFLGGGAFVHLRRTNSTLRLGAGILASMSLSTAIILALSPQQITREPTDQTAKGVPLQRHSSGTLKIDEWEGSDIVWNILKSFSILTVREGKGNMHRLLAQALRTGQSDEESCYHMQICADSLKSIWKFDPRKAETWQESFHVVEHVKALVLHISENEQSVCVNICLQAGILSIQAGVFSAMAMNGFKEAQASLELALKLFNKLEGEQKSSRNKSVMEAKAEALHELGRTLRYQGNFKAAEEALLEALSIRNALAQNDGFAKHFVADTLHELGVLEVKKHKLDTAQKYLIEALSLRRTLDENSGGDINADCAATLHQLATVHVARKPPSLEKAEELLQEALKLSRQIGQRAATLKQLARVTIRQGLLDTAENYLRRALELYVELYGKRTMHINVAAVKFQQGALACQREQFEQAWVHFSECLRIRRHVYAYARPLDSTGNGGKPDPLHLEVSCVLHELGCVAFAQNRFSQAMTMLQSERSILQNLQESTTQSERLLQAMLTNLTWLRKCAKEMGDETTAALFSTERAQLKSKAKARTKESGNGEQHAYLMLQREALRCRVAARQFALGKKEDNSLDRKDILEKLSNLAQEIEMSRPGTLRDASKEFHDSLITSLQKNAEVVPRSDILGACDRLRDALRAHGAQVNDMVSTSS